jgi:hypothetical protein
MKLIIAFCLSIITTGTTLAQGNLSPIKDDISPGEFLLLLNGLSTKIDSISESKKDFCSKVMVVGSPERELLFKKTESRVTEVMEVKLPQKGSSANVACIIRMRITPVVKDTGCETFESREYAYDLSVDASGNIISSEWVTKRLRDFSLGLSNKR